MSLFLAFAFVLAAIDSSVALMTRQEDVTATLATTSEHVSLLLTLIVGHRRCFVRIKGCRTWAQAWSFGLLWATLWLAVARVSPDQGSNGFTPSAARHQYLRPLLRVAGESGIDILLGTSAYIVFLCLDLLMDQPEGRDTETWEWYSLLRHSRSTRNDPDLTGSLKSTTFESSRTNKSSRQSTYLSSDGRLTQLCSRPTSRSEHQPTRSEQDQLRPDRGTIPTYGSLSDLTISTNLIDLESARSSVPSRSFRSAQVPAIHGTEVIPISPNMSGTITPLSSTTEVEDDEDAAMQPEAFIVERETVITAIIVLLLWAFLLCLPRPVDLSLSAPLRIRTPLSVACVLPPRPHTLNNLIYHSQTVAARSKLLVWPKHALHLASDEAKAMAIEWVHEMVTAQYGVWVVMSFEIGIKEPESQVIMVGPDGLMEGTSNETNNGSVVQSSRDVGKEQWTIQLAPLSSTVWLPHGVTRFNWTQDFPHLRPVHVAAVDISAAGRADMIASSDILPSIITIPSSSPSDQRELSMARDLAVKHGIPVILCASSCESSTSALINPWGDILFRQQGGETWSATLALSYRDGQTRPPTGYEVLGNAGPLIISAALLVILVIADYGQWFLASHFQDKATYHDSLSSLLTSTSEYFTRSNRSRSSEHRYESEAPRTWSTE